MKEIIENRLQYHKNELLNLKILRSQLHKKEEIENNEEEILDLISRINELTIILSLIK